MATEIRIDAPGDGDWIAAQVSGYFRSDYDHVIATHRDGGLLGGFIVSDCIGETLAVHAAGFAPGWITRDLMWMLFHYTFIQLRCRKLLAPVAADNHAALAQNLRAGFRLEATLRDALGQGKHLLLLTMGVAECRWLRIIPQQYLPGDVARKVDHGR